MQSLRKGHGRQSCIESDPNYSGAQTKRLCVSEQPEWADENERPKAMSLAAICAPVLKLARVQSYKVRRLNFRCAPCAEVVSRNFKKSVRFRAVQRDPLHKLLLFL